MTLLESLVALVILGLSAVGFLELFQRITVTTRDTAAWTRAVAVAEWSMERAVLGTPALSDTVDGLPRRVVVQPWRGRVREVVVTVELPAPQGARVELRRLVSAP
jgi:type II secretory pathway pseudopilin PulG